MFEPDARNTHCTMMACHPYLALSSRSYFHPFMQVISSAFSEARESEERHDADRKKRCYRT